MSISNTPPSGFRDFLPEAAALRARAAATIAAVYESFGFQRVATSAFEDLAVLLGKGGGENEKLIFKVLKRGEQLEKARAAGEELADMGLRFDLTVPLARYHAKHGGGQHLPNPFKAFQMGPVWRADRPQKGRFREFWQCDADILGSESWACEVEVITALVTAIEKLGLARPRVLINDRVLVNALLDQAGVAEAQRQPVCVILDKQDKIPRDKLMAELTELVGEPATRGLETSLLAERVDPDVLRAAAPEAVANLERIIDALQRLNGPESFMLAPGLMRGMDYYTGPVFELQQPGFSGSIGGGGRYDGLSGKFGGPAAVPAFGGSLGFERLMLLLEEANPTAAATVGPDAVITVFSDDLRLPALELAARLRAAGLTADLYPGTGKLKAQFRYADQKRARYCLVLGPDEAAQGTVKVKEMQSGSEATVPVADVAAHVARQVS